VSDPAPQPFPPRNQGEAQIEFLVLFQFLNQDATQNLAPLRSATRTLK
jgi:hypothetical protein